MSKKQITLFDTWNKNSLSQSTGRSDFNALDAEGNVSSTVHQLSTHNAASPNVFQSPKYSKTDKLADAEFDYEAGKTWIYPTNYPVRDYQFSIVKEALFKNTLVILPTGLGKTFIAAVVMYNIYRWYPFGKVIFMAPTKPLVAQQIDACFKITGISQDDTTQMTGTNSPELRKRMWLKKRVFFLTPQVLVNDIVRNICPASAVKCLVVDEAHKALGNHAYCQVIKELCNYTAHFRVLALTATPGSETQAVKQVLSNLLISHVEMRSEESEDVRQYSHVRDIEKIIVPLGDRLNTFKMRFLDVINVYLKRLTLRKVMTTKNPGSLSKFQMLKLREMFSQHPPSNIDRFTYGLAMADFSLCISLYHAYELLLLHGATSFYNFLTGILNGDKSIPHARSELLKNFEFEEIMKDIKENYIPESCDQKAQNENLEKKAKKLLPGHPKLEKLLEVVLQHFKTAEKGNINDTRVMIFTQYRDSVKEIVDMLNQYQPMLKAMSFVGQASKSGTSVGYSQKQQLKVIQQFRCGGYNTLVSTCVGEEGLDIGEVDLIVCYDCPKSPIRLVQRMGRTGRLRKGRIIILIAEGKEQQMYNTCEYRKKTVNRAISKGFPFAQFYQNSPSLIPAGVKPVCVKTVVTIEPKKLMPKSKESPNPYLTEEEMMEYNQHVKVPKSNIPLLPKAEFVIFKNPAELMCSGNESGETSARPQLSLSEWTLWQTTPQRTHMIPHSSKSLLLVKTLEFIHFPELLTSKNVSFNISNASEKNENISKMQDQSQSSFRQSKITDLLSTSKAVDNDLQDDFIQIISSPEKEVYEISRPTLKLSDVGKGIPLIQQLFSISLPKSVNKSSLSDLRQPPLIENLLNIDFSNVDLKKSDSTEGDQSNLILHMLNKKMQAKLKRKSKELGKNIAFHSTKTFTPIKNVNSSNLIENSSTFDISFDTNISQCESHNVVNNQLEPKTVSFDIDFDFSDPVSDNLKSKTEDETVLYRLSDGHNKKRLSVLQNVERNGDVKKLNNDFVSFKNVPNIKQDQKVVSSHGTSDVQTYCESEAAVENDSSEKIPMNFFLGDKSSNNIRAFENHNVSKSLNISSDVVKEKHCIIEDRQNKCIPHTAQVQYDDFSFNSNKKSADTKECQSKHIVYEKNVLDSSKIKFNDVPCNAGLASIMKHGNKNSESQDASPISFDFNINFADNDVFDHISEDAIKMQTDDAKNNYTSNSCNLSVSNNGKVLLQNESFSDVSNNKNTFVPKKVIEDLAQSEYGNISINNDMSNKISQNNDHITVEKEKESNTDECNLCFDVSFSFDNNQAKVGNDNASKLPNITNETTIEYSVAKDMSPVNNLEEFNDDANSIVEQLFTSQNTLSVKQDCSFSSPLTVKRCLSEIEPHENEISCKKRIKTFDNILTSSQENKFKGLDVFKVPAVKKSMLMTKNKHFSKNNLNKSVNVTQESQYSMTQLLSLIDSSESLDKSNSVKSPSVVRKDLQKCSDVLDVSSEDEICPTPPKEVAKAKAQFIYSNKNVVKKSLSFESFEPHKQSKLQKNTSRTQGDFNFSLTYEHPKLLKDLNESCKLQDTYDKINIDSSVSLGKKITSCNNKANNLSTKESEINCENISSKINESQSSEKITFDISFNFPFTQEFSSSLESQPFDLNKAICMESFSDKEQIVENGNNNDSLKLLEQKKNEHVTNLGKESISENLKKDIDIIEKSCSKDEYISDDIDCEDSESLLPSKPLEMNILNPPDISYDLFSSKQSTKFSKDFCHNPDTSNVKTLDKQNMNIVKVPCSSIEKTKELNSLLSDELEQNIFENNISCSLLSPEDSKRIKSNDLLRSISNSNCDFEKMDLEDFECTKDKNNLSLEENNALCKRKSSNLVCHVASDFSSKVQPLVFEKKSSSTTCLNESEIQKHKSTSHENKLESKQDLRSSQSKFSESNVISDISMVFSEEKLLFDLCYDNDETCNLLPAKRNSNNFGNTIKSEKSANTNYLSKGFGKSTSSNLASDLKKTEELKESCKNFVLKNDEICSFNKKCSEKNAGDVNENEEFSCEFELSAADQKLLQEIERNNASVSQYNKGPVSCINANKEIDSNDEFDFNDKCQSILKQKKLNQQCLESSANKPVNSGSVIAAKLNPTNKYDLSGKDQSGISEKKLGKLSSKLSVRNKTKFLTNNVLKNNSCIEEDEDDFQFVRKIQKKSGESSEIKGRIQEKNISRKRKKTNRHAFLLSQAEVSDSDDSGDESACDDDEKDDLLESFIDDDSPQKCDDTDQHAIYLQSLKNCHGLPQKFKLKVLENRNQNYFSEPPGENSNYMYDSFCVNDEDIAYISSDDDIECNKKSLHKTKKSKKTKNLSKKMKRIITHDSTTSSEHEISPPKKMGKDVASASNLEMPELDDSIITAKKHKPKLVIISSDEDDIFVKPANVESHENRTENNVPHVNNINSKSSSVIPVVDLTETPSHTEKIEFSLNFDENDGDFIPAVANKKAETDISMTLINSSRDNVSCNSDNILNVFNNNPSTSKFANCAPNSKLTECNIVDDIDLRDVSFDLGWDDMDFPLTSNDIVSASKNSPKKISETLNVRKSDESFPTVILVDSRELASGKPVISALRSKHNINPIVMQLNSADYIISNRMGVERVSDSEFSSCPMPPKIIEKIKLMNEIFERSVVIIERDCRKHILSFNKNTTKYLQFVMHLNHCPSTVVLFSKSVEDTSALISDFIQHEKKKGFHINVPVSLNPKNQKLYDFYVSFPKISPVCALYLMYFFPTLESFSKSSVEELKKKCNISSHKALSIFRYFRNELTFHENS